jgi:Ala-tRNA(Pro) deacylase
VTDEDRLYADFAALNIAYEVHGHEAVFTVDDSESLHGDIAGAHTKNLFLKDNGGLFWLVTVPAAMRVDLKALPAAIGCKRVSFGKAEDMERLLGLTPGSVTPLGVIHDQNFIVRVVIDARLVAAETINVHPLRNTATLSLSPDDLVRALTHWGHAPLIATIAELEFA